MCSQTVVFPFWRHYAISLIATGNLMIYKMVSCNFPFFLNLHFIYKRYSVTSEPNGHKSKKLISFGNSNECVRARFEKNRSVIFLGFLINNSITLLDLLLCGSDISIY